MKAILGTGNICFHFTLGSLKTTTLSTTTTEDVTESTVASAVTTKTTSELRTTEQKTTNPTTQQKTTNPTTQLLSTTTSAEEKISTTGSLTTDGCLTFYVSIYNVNDIIFLSIISMI